MLRAMSSLPSGAPPPAGQPPNTYAGLTYWYSGDDSIMYIYPGGASNVLSTADGVAPVRIDSAGGISRSMGTGGSGFFTHKNPLVGSARGLRKVTTDNATNLGTKPSGADNVTAFHNISTYWAAATKCLVVAVKVSDAPADSGNPYGNPSILSDAAGGYCGLHFYRSGSNIIFQAYSWTGGANTVTATVAIGTWVVVTMRHASGQLRIKINGGAWTSAAAGSTDVMSGAANVFLGAGVSLDCPQWASYNANRTDAELLEVARYMGAKVGLSF